MKHYVNFGLLFAFTILVISAALRFFEPFSLITTRIHIIFGIFVLLLVALHLAARVKYFTQRIGGKSNKGSSIKLWLMPVISCTYLVVACFQNWWPVPQLISGGYEAKNRSIIFRSESGTALRNINDKTQLKRASANAASILVEVEWGEGFDIDLLFPDTFNKARPQVAVWAESSVGSLIETFFVSEESAFSESFEWAGNERRRVDILPIWRHQFTLASGVEPDGEIDTYSGATPEHSFSVDRYIDEDPEGFYINLEVNIPNDPNEFYNNDQEESADGYTLPGIGQPSTMFSAFIDPTKNKKYYLMEYVGHGGSSSQQSGDVYYDSQNISTAKNLIEKVLIRIERP